ncbi:hypothetical protein CPB83DRAFT_908484 [Crepidotus variabilis]|uniref:F-box domain-containing protein n=1 Tax=Crepidotus variabilis TaxID=179855 RepID=A0A9P6ECH3_9AGAR|nr:hypothetical protein CPB83DRAFT_908484 [Crepidotus variabilis]
MASGKCSINKLPAELLAEIFDFSIDRERFGDSERHELYFRIHGKAAPLNLVGVCRLWRILALNTTTLWDSISFHSSHKLPRIKGWLDLAPNVRFSLKTPHYNPSDKTDDSRVCSIFRLLSKTCNRWKSLSTFLGEMMAEEFLAFLQNVDLASLSLNDLAITVDFFTPSFEEKLSSVVSYLPFMPTIQHLTFEVHRTCNVHLQDLNIPWSQYETIHIQFPNLSIEEIALCLSNCIVAKRIHFHSWGSQPLPHPSRPYDPPFSLDSLTTLSLSKGVDPLNILPYFTLPNLNELLIDVRERNHAALESFLLRTPSLHTLIIGESLQPSYEFVGASDQDLVYWFCSAYLRCLPCFQLLLHDVDSPKRLGRDFIERVAKTGVAFPPLICFRGDHIAGVTRKNRFEFIGWRDRLQEGCQVYWTYKEGVFQ